MATDRVSGACQTGHSTVTEAPEKLVGLGFNPFEIMVILADEYEPNYSIGWVHNKSGNVS